MSVPAAVFHPGEYLADELTERGESVEDFAARIDYPVLFVRNVLAGRYPMIYDFAVRTSLALGTSKELWFNLQATWDAHPTRRTAPPAAPRPAEET